MARIIRESDSTRFGKLVVSSIIVSIITFLLGFVVFIFSEKVEIFMGYLVGALFAYEGLVTIFKYLKRDGAKLYSYNMIFGILMLILGAIIIFVPKSIASMLMVGVGLFFVVLGSNKLTYGVWLKIGNAGGWLLTFFIGLMIIAFGILIMLNPFSASITTTKLVGIFLMLTGALDFTNSIMIKNNQDDIVKIFW